MKCKICFNEFKPKRIGQKCCSRSCNAKNHNIELGKKFKCPVCIVCGKLTRRLSTAKYCSLKCQGINKRGNKHHNWNGGIKKHPEGYVYIYSPEHPNKDVSGYVLEHRLIIEKFINRFLTEKEVVHHLNGIKDDNRLKNLVLLRTQADHLKEHNYLLDSRKRER